MTEVSSPAWTDDGVVACVVDSRLSMPCGDVALRLEPDVDVHGPIAFRGSQVYFASPDGSGMVALWTADVESKKARRISSFSRDAYGPSAGGDTVVFKTQTYRTFLADAPAAGGATRQLATFQSETPSYHPARNLIAFTYGTWRRQLDDAKYPDIAQEIGVIDVGGQVPLDAPSEVIAKSDSEDQAMAWSPNGQWIAFHTHREMSDDVWLRPADGSQPDKRITFLGRGAEVGWPRWSPDGRTVLLNGARKRDGALPQVPRRIRLALQHGEDIARFERRTDAAADRLQPVGEHDFGVQPECLGDTGQIARQHLGLRGAAHLGRRADRKIDDEVGRARGDLFRQHRRDQLAFGIEIEREGFETVGGFLLSHLGRMPYLGETFSVDGLSVEVLEVERRRITKVRVRRREQPAMENGEAERRG